MVKMTVRCVAPDSLETILAPPSLFRDSPPGDILSEGERCPVRKMARCRYSQDCCKLFACSNAVGLASRPHRYSGITMEQLDHRLLPGVNFTENVLIVFLATQVTDVVGLPANKLVRPAKLSDRFNHGRLGF